MKWKAEQLTALARARRVAPDELGFSSKRKALPARAV
jgi:hypothetical protein